MEAVCPPETLVAMCESTRRSKQEDDIVNVCDRESLKSYKNFYICFVTFVYGKAFGYGVFSTVARCILFQVISCGGDKVALTWVMLLMFLLWFPPAKRRVRNSSITAHSLCHRIGSAGHYRYRGP